MKALDSFKDGFFAFFKGLGFFMQNFVADPGPVKVLVGTKKPLMSYVIRSFPVFLVLFLLVFQQFLFSDFIDAKLGISIYSLCFIVLFIESLFLFFYKENRDFEPLLLLCSALFLMGLAFFVQEIFLFFLGLCLAGYLIFALLFLNKIFSGFLFFIYTIALLPFVSFSLQNFSLKEQKSFTFFALLFLGFCFLFAMLFRWFLNRESKTLSSPDQLVDSYKDLSDLMSVQFARKLKPFLNAFSKYFPEEDHKEGSDYKDKKNLVKGIKSNLFSEQKILPSFRKLQNYIKDFIEYNEIDKKAWSVSEINLHEFLQSLLEELQDHPKKPEKIKIKNDISDTFVVKASKEHLKKAFQHIVLNAFEALKEEQKAQLRLLASKQEYGVLIEFLDNGQGIEKEEELKIFDPFYSKREFGKGLRGFGLAYVQKVIQAHHGEVTAKSMEKGTLITVKLPLSQKKADPPLKSLKKKAV